MNGNIFAIYMPTSVAWLIQLMDWGVIQIMEYIWKQHFLRKLVNSEGSVQCFLIQYAIEDAMCNIASAWKGVQEHLSPENLDETVAFCNVWDAEEEFLGFVYVPDNKKVAHKLAELV